MNKSAWAARIGAVIGVGLFAYAVWLGGQIVQGRSSWRFWERMEVVAPVGGVTGDPTVYVLAGCGRNLTNLVFAAIPPGTRVDPTNTICGLVVYQGAYYVAYVVRDVTDPEAMTYTFHLFELAVNGRGAVPSVTGGATVTVDEGGWCAVGDGEWLC